MTDGVRAKWPTPTCIIHVGTHKTGSTTIQHFLQANTEALARAGIQVPRSGRLADTPDGCGHHCIAWDVLGADPSAPVDASLELLIEEIRSAAMPVACISSEEFAHLYAIPNNMQRLRRGLAGIGYRAVVVMYLRPQTDYLEALYAEVAQHASVRDFWSCYREVLKHGAVDLWHENRFAALLNYKHLVERFALIFGVRNVVVRPFRRDASPHYLIRDFMRIVAGPSFQTEGLTIGAPAAKNGRAGFASVVRSISTNLDRGGISGGARLADVAETGPLEGPFEVLRAHEIAKICWKFARTNWWLFRRYGIVISGVSARRLSRTMAGLRNRARGRTRVRLLRSLFEDGPV